MIAEKNVTQRDHKQCMGMLLPVRDALDFLSGKWKLPIIISLSFGNKRFKELATDVEQNQLVKRTVYDSVPVRVEYSLTDYGSSLDKVIVELRAWGVQHRRRIMKK